MTILVDYRCKHCSTITEAFVESPAPSERTCTTCGETSRRAWSPVGLISGASSAKSAQQGPDVKPARRSLCATNPDVPGLCHMSESAGRAWIARYKGDGRSLDRELERQEKAAKVSTPTMSDAISHNHSHTATHESPSHDHD